MPNSSLGAARVGSPYCIPPLYATQYQYIIVCYGQQIAGFCCIFALFFVVMQLTIRDYPPKYRAQLAL